jgi:hypothetical protein
MTVNGMVQSTGRSLIQKGVLALALHAQQHHSTIGECAKILLLALDIEQLVCMQLFYR